MEQNMQFRIGDTISWDSAAGHEIGTILEIVISKNAANHFVPWINLETAKGKIRLCANHNNIEMLKIKHWFSIN
jgi:hypothetical protein